MKIVTIAVLIGALLSGLLSGCAYDQVTQSALLMKQQREAGELLMVHCRAGDVQACIYARGL